MSASVNTDDTQPCTHQFANCSADEAVACLWLDCDGEEREYHRLPPGHATAQSEMDGRTPPMQSARSHSESGLSTLNFSSLNPSALYNCAHPSHSVRSIVPPLTTPLSMGNESLAISRQEPAPRAPLHADNRTLHNPRMALSMHACFPPKHGAVHAGVFITHACRCACMQAPIPRTHGASKALKAGTSETTAVRGRFLLCMLRYLDL